MAGPVLKLKPQMLKPQRVVAFKDENLGFRRRLKSVTVAIWYHVSCSFQFDSISSSPYLPVKRLLISIVLLLVGLSFSSLEANLQDERYWGTIIRNPPANYVLRMDDGKILNAEWESGYDQWSIGERVILTTESGSGIMFFENRRTQVAVFPYDPSL